MENEIILAGKLIEIIETSRKNALRKVNEELIHMYWLVGEYLSIESKSVAFGDKYIDTIAKEIQDMFPGIKGFNRRGLYRMCIKEAYSKRELERQIDSGYYERYMLSKEKILPEPIKGLKENPFLDSYVIEFLNLPKDFWEADLRKGLIQNMKDFILEVGKDFTFIDEEYRVQVGGEDFRINLLFFHRGLQCLVAFELKLGKFKPEYISKMDFYLEALDRQKRKIMKIQVWE